MEKGAGGRLLEAAAAAAAEMDEPAELDDSIFAHRPSARRETFPVASSSYLACIQFQHDDHAVLIWKLHTNRVVS
jgi:hypothetical protein